MISKSCPCGAEISRKAKHCPACANAVSHKKLMRPVPDDFAEVAPGKKVEELRAIYRCGAEAIHRWRVEAGIPIVRAVPPSGKREAPDGFALVAPQLTMKALRERYGACEAVVRRWCAIAGVEPRKAGVVRFRQVTPRPLNDHREQSRVGLAAQFLQKFGPVFRCDKNGRAEPKGSHWRRGSAILTDAELMQRAERNGWQPDAWRSIAA